MEELERYNQEYKKRLDEAGELGEIPENLALEVLSGWIYHVLVNGSKFDPYKHV